MEDKYRYNGLHATELTESEIHEILRGGIRVPNAEAFGYTGYEAVFYARLRLEVELVRRQLGIPMR